MRQKFLDSFNMQQDKILFSIVIPAYNEENTLPMCVEALRKLKADFEYEIIAVDNNSKDNTFQVAEQLGIKAIKEKRQGVSWARKTGTEAAQGEYILHIDADTRLPQNYLNEVIKRFQKNPKLVCLGGQFYYYDAPWWKNILRIYVHWNLYLFALIISRGKIGPMANNMTFKKSVYDQTDGFNTYFRFGEDIDLTKRMSKFGKIKLDMSLKCRVSVRRHKLGWKLMVYWINFYSMCLVGKPFKNALPLPDEN